MAFQVVIVLGNTLSEFEDSLCGAARQRKYVDLNVLQDDHFPPPPGARSPQRPEG